MANAEKIIQDNADKLGATWVPPVSLKELIDQNRIRIAGTDNAIVLEIDGEAWSVPEAFRLAFFP